MVRRTLIALLSGPLLLTAPAAWGEEYSLRDGSRLTFTGASASRIAGSDRVLLTLNFVGEDSGEFSKLNRAQMIQRLDAEVFEICRSHASGLLERLREANPQMNFARVEISLTKNTRTAAGGNTDLEWTQEFTLSDGKCADPY